MPNLKEVFESSVNEMMDRIIEEESDLNNQDLEELFDIYFEEDFNSYYEWWSFNESELTIDNMNELLTCYSSLVSDGLAPCNDLSVEKLLRLYPHYRVGLWRGEFIELLKGKFESSSDENNSSESDENTEQL
jgi:hypothetical protein